MLSSIKNSLMITCSLDNSTAHVTLKIRPRSPKLSHLFALSQYCIQVSFKIILDLVPGKRLDFIEFQDAKLTKIEDFHKKDAADETFFFNGMLVRYDIT